jgi:2-polyprenyl-6-methoxyphenol hydroxylase-like FAD-dependent oxidoreductase
MRILVSGASIAGPTAAYWLARDGAEVTVVEKAPALRGGGHDVDVRGVQLEVLRRMDLVGAVHERRSGVTGIRIVDADGRTRVRLPSWVLGGELEIGRGDLAALLHERTRDDARYVFGDRVAAIEQDAGGVDVRFASGRWERYDLVVGADGLRSGVRSALLGPDDRSVEYRGYHHAGFTMPNVLGLDHEGVLHTEPGIGVSLGSGRDPERAAAGLVVAAPGRERLTAAEIAGLAVGAGWETPRILAAMAGATDVWVSALAQVRLDRYANGRVVLLGDAAWGAGPGGSGTGLAMTAAHVLAAALRTSGGDHEAAFARYEAAVRPAAAVGLRQARDAGKRFLAPPTARAIRMRDRTLRVMSTRPVRPLLERLAGGAANALHPDAATPTALRSRNAAPGARTERSGSEVR